jgi:hypothetical protein
METKKLEIINLSSPTANGVFGLDENEYAAILANKLQKIADILYSEEMQEYAEVLLKNIIRNKFLRYLLDLKIVDKLNQIVPTFEEKLMLGNLILNAIDEPDFFLEALRNLGVKEEDIQEIKQQEFISIIVRDALVILNDREQAVLLLLFLPELFNKIEEDVKNDNID